MGVGVNVLRPRFLLRSLLLCHKINTLGATLLRVNINTTARWPGGQPGVSGLRRREGQRLFFHDDRSTNTESARVRDSHRWSHVKFRLKD